MCVEGSKTRQLENLAFLTIKQHKPIVKDIMCFTCGEKRHIASQCTKRTTSFVVCSYCRKPGHAEADCYTKKRDVESKKCREPVSRSGDSRAEGAMVCKDIPHVDAEEEESEEILTTKRNVTGEPLPKRVRGLGDSTAAGPTVRINPLRTVNKNEKESRSKKGAKPKSTTDAL